MCFYFFPSTYLTFTLLDLFIHLQRSRDISKESTDEDEGDGHSKQDFKARKMLNWSFYLGGFLILWSRF